MYRQRYVNTLFSMLLITALVAGYSVAGVFAETSNQSRGGATPVSPAGQTATLQIFLPLVAGSRGSAATHTVPRVNAPFFADKVSFPEMAIFWFGRVNSTENYADVRVGYSPEELNVRLAIFDRYLWYNPASKGGNLEAWDAVSLFINQGGNKGSTLVNTTYRFVGQLNWWEGRENYQAVFQGDGAGWKETAATFETKTGWRGNAPNDNSGNDRGWTISFSIPFSSLGLSGPPAEDDVWGLAMILHDRDDGNGTPIEDKAWPERMDPVRPETWGQLNFGLPTYSPPILSPSGTVTIRNKLDGVTVKDGAVGGRTVCGSGLDFWSEWGDVSQPLTEENDKFNIQNQLDIADWPCFSRYYVTFPLDKVPQGKTILSATLKMHQFGNSGGGEWGEPPPSLIQVLIVGDNWDPSTLTWNNAPPAIENVSQTWVDIIREFPGWPGVPSTWDVTRTVAEAYVQGTPVRLALYSADDAYHSGKYFISAQTANWNATARPTLMIVWGQP